MKKTLSPLAITIIITVSSFFNFMISQSIDNGLHHILKWDIGVAGTWINYEYPISENFALVSEVGVNPILFSRAGDPIGVLLSGRLKQGIRLFYDREHRFNEGLVSNKNTGNFFTLAIDYQPPNFSWSSESSKMVLREVRIMPSWGLRRSIGKRFIIEGHLGFGYGYALDSSVMVPHNLVYDIKVAIGFLLFGR